MFTDDEEEPPAALEEKTSDQIIYEFGAPEDFTGQTCIPLRNVWSMCYQTKMPDHMELYR